MLHIYIHNTYVCICLVTVVSKTVNSYAVKFSHFPQNTQPPNFLLPLRLLMQLLRRNLETIKLSLARNPTSSFTSQIISFGFSLPIAEISDTTFRCYDRLLKYSKESPDTGLGYRDFGCFEFCECFILKETVIERRNEKKRMITK